jgi:glycosyltransferase involved in cell wall biosynthesis
MPDESEVLRVCIVAETASFRFGGEASLPLHYFSRLRARQIETWLVVHARTRSELEALFPADQGRIRYIADQWYHKLMWMLSRTLPRRVSEATFGLLMLLINQGIQRRIIKELIRNHGVNLLHQVIPVSPKAPSLISGFKVPVIIGPMNGGMEYPPAFRSAESWLTRLLVGVGRRSASLANRIFSGKIYAKILFVANQRTRQALPCGVRGKIVEFPENGVDLALWLPASDSTVSPTTACFLFLGRLVDWKRLDFVIRALPSITEAKLEVIGDGPMRSIWRALAESLGVSNRVYWHGWLPQAECARILHGATALLLPSIYECGGAVVLEAMACKIPVVATSWGGPADYLDPSCGILIEIPNASQSDAEAAIIQGFVDAMRKLIIDAGFRSKLGISGRKRVEQFFDWNKKIDRMLIYYREVFDQYRASQNRSI